MIVTYPKVLSIDEYLRHCNTVRLHPLPYFLLILVAHKDVLFFELDQQRTQNLLYAHAFGIGFPNDTHTGAVDNNLTIFLILVVL